MDDLSNINEDMLVIEEERMLFAEIRGISENLKSHYDQSDYSGALTLLAGLSVGIEAFFESVMVMDDNPDIRRNRLSLLSELKSLFDRIANLALVG